MVTVVDGCGRVAICDGTLLKRVVGGLKLCTPVQADERVLKGSGFRTFREA